MTWLQSIFLMIVILYCSEFILAAFARVCVFTFSRKGCLWFRFCNARWRRTWFDKYIYGIVIFLWLDFPPFPRLGRPFQCDGRPFRWGIFLDIVSNFWAFNRIAETFLSAAQFSHWRLEPECGAWPRVSPLPKPPLAGSEALKKPFVYLPNHP